MPKSKGDLRSLILSYTEALSFWRKSFQQSKSVTSDIKAAEVNDPLHEVSKLAKLIKAHSTKVGIVFKPENLNGQYEPAYNSLQKLSESVVLLISITMQLDPATVSKIFYDEIVTVVNLILDSNHDLLKELIVIESELEEHTEKKSHIVHGETDGRLVSVGKIWANCDSLNKLIEIGKLGLLTKKIKQSISLIEDGLDEFEEWAQNPDEIKEDPFAFSDDDEDSVVEKSLSNNEHNSGSDLEDGETSKEELIAFAKLWLSKIKLIKLLLSSLTRTLPSISSGEIVNNIYETQRKIVGLIDKLIVDLMLDQIVDDQVKSYTGDIVESCNEITKIVKDANKLDENKTKWCIAWDTKFKEDL